MIFHEGAIQHTGRGWGRDERHPNGKICHDVEVTMADCPGWPHPPTFSWNAGMVVHILKSDPVLRELEHVQVDGPGMAYLFFYDKQGHRGLGQDTTHTIRTHVEEAFSEWILHSTYFTISLFPLREVWRWAVVTSDCQRLRGRVENMVPSIPAVNAGESDSLGQLVGSTAQLAGRGNIKGGANARPAQ